MKLLYNRVFLIVLLVIVVSVKMYAQEEEKKKNYIHKANSVFFAPFNILDPINPSFQVGYERMVHPKLALQFEYGYILKKTLLDKIINPNDKEDEYNHKGYKLRFELKYFIKKQTNYGLYTSCELFYMRNVSGVNGTFIVSDTSFDYSFEMPEGYETDPREIEYVDYFTNDKTKYGANVKFGVKVFPGSFMLESYIGLGIANRNNKHSGRENINDKESYNDVLHDTVKGEKWIFNLPLNIKVGYRF